jgi:hypothetical protein
VVVGRFSVTGRALGGIYSMSPTSFDRDAEMVRHLIHEHLPSARPAPPDRSPLTVGEVACQLRADRSVPDGDRDAVLGLLALDLPLPPQLKVSQLVALTPGVTLSAAFWRTFRETAVCMGLARVHEPRARRG